MLITMCWNKLMQVVLACYTDFEARADCLQAAPENSLHCV